MNINFFYNIKNKIISDYKLNKVVKKIVKLLFNSKTRKKLEINFVFVDSKEIKKYNKKFLKKNSVTDVLCFQYDKFSADIVVCIPEVINNSKFYNTTAEEELLLVIIHGLLHFKGMKDNTKLQKERMLNTAKKIMEKLNLQNCL